MTARHFEEPLRLLLVEDYEPMFELLHDDLLESATFPIEVVGANSLTLAESMLQQTTIPPHTLCNRFEESLSRDFVSSDPFDSFVLPETRYAIDLVLSDLTLPDCCGVATVERLRKAAVRRPILILTSWDDGVLFAQCEAAGADICRVKGRTNGQELLSLIEQLMIYN